MSLDDEQANKKRRISPEPSSASLSNGAAPAVAPQEAPDEDNAAPPSTAAGAHAKPLSALFAGPAPASPVKKKGPAAGAAGGKGKGKAEPDVGEGFESILARLQEGGEWLYYSSIGLQRAQEPRLLQGSSRKGWRRRVRV